MRAAASFYKLLGVSEKKPRPNYLRNLDYLARPTGPFTILETQELEIGKVYVAKERRATDFEAQKFGKG